MSDDKTSMEALFGAPISVYTRAEAIADGTLIDVTSTAEEAGFRFPVAVTAHVWDACVAWSDADSMRQTIQHESGRLWDVVWMTSIAARRAPRGEGLIKVRLNVIPRGGRARTPRPVDLWATIGPDDAGAPCVTIMFPEDY